jgi:hypothetical protein
VIGPSPFKLPFWLIIAGIAGVAAVVSLFR